MLRGRGLRGWFGPRFLFLLTGWTMSTLTWNLADWNRHVVLALIIILASWLDQREWKGMLYYMSLLSAMNRGTIDGFSFTRKEAGNADPES